jgi:hypothetical protein
VRWTLRRTLWVVVCLATTALEAAPSPRADLSPLVEAFRMRIAEAEQMADPFDGGFRPLAGSSLVDMAKVDFIVNSTHHISSRYVNDNDRKFVLSAVRGQSPEELEAHLPALVNYVRVSTAVVLYHRRIRAQELLYGEQRGVETLRSIGQRVTEFRVHHLALVRARKMNPAEVLTAANLGEFGDPQLLTALETAYDDGRSQFLNQRNGVVGLLLLVQLGIGFGIAVIFLQKQRLQSGIQLQQAD